ncbi:dimethylarginine dimethylaminohydrolase family protein [Halopenitus persicus]|uniref:N-Dimethylarginine dimethylaminohydrolase n=1 Tax=Halopenitus persicus TaxID=1048396 RepID=A0A1H3FN34_9EURY|nr:arginine deiminase family protein [Halopenitus persicus]QHS16730.1 amidinotransferase [haloarchaeon 3A1-DGR]SDX92406.1 N-Dimethylarginine dimethylaminohydrolase [Halopenitus persicus]
MSDVWDLEPSVRSEYGRLERVLVHEPGAEFNTVVDPDAWNWDGLPRQERAAKEHRALVETLEDRGVEVHHLTEAFDHLAESLFVRDVGFAIGGGIVVGKMVEETRHGEERRLSERVIELGTPIYHSVHGDGGFEAGNMVWIDEGTVAIGRSRTTNAAGIRQVRTVLETFGIDVIEVPIFGSTESTGQTHLALVFSMVAPDLALVYSEAVPPEFLDTLHDRGIDTIPVPMREQRNRATSTIVVEPGTIVLSSGNHEVRAALETRGFEVVELAMQEIRKAGGGPKGLVLPLERTPVEE